MPIDPNIALGVKPIEMPNQLNQLAQFMQIQNLQRQNQLGQMTLDEQTQKNAEQVAFMNAVKNGTLNLREQQGQIDATTQFPRVAPTAVKAIIDAGKDTAQTGHFNAQASAENALAAQRQNETLVDQRQRQLGMVKTPEDAAAWQQQWSDPRYASLGFTPQQIASDAASVPKPGSSPADLLGWIQQQHLNALGAKDRIANDTTIRGQNLTAATSRANSADTNATSRSNNENTVTMENRRAGLDKNGNFVGFTTPPPVAAPSVATAGAAPAAVAPTAGAAVAPIANATPTAPAKTPVAMQATIDAIGQYQQPSTYLSRYNAAQKDYILGEVHKQYPDYGGDPVYFASKQALQSFAPGKKDRAEVESANISNNHLDTLRQLALAQQNGDYPLVNKIARAWASANGQPAPTNYDAAVQMIAPEVSKSVVSANGGVTDREHTYDVLKGGLAPQQILGSIGTIQDLLGGRLVEKERSYKQGTRRDDFDTMLSDTSKAMLTQRKTREAQASGKGGTGNPKVDAYLEKYGAH